MEREEGLQSLLKAARYDDVDTLKALFSEYDGVTLSDGRDLKSFLLHEASAAGSLRTVEELIRLGAEIDAPDEDGDTALYYALSQQQIPVLKFLLSRDANINTRGQQGSSPLHATVRMNNSEIAKLLLDAGAYVDVANDRGETPLMQASSTGNDVLVDLFIKYGADVNAIDNDGDGVLVYATSRCQVEVAEKLLKCGARVNATNNTGDTALMNVVKTQNVPDIGVVLALLRSGANVSELYDADCAFIVWGKDGVGSRYIRERDITLETLNRNDLNVARVNPNSPLYQEIYG